MSFNSTRIDQRWNVSSGPSRRIILSLEAPTNSFVANALYAELSLLAYNIVTWFKRLCLPDEWQSFTLPTIRHRLLMMPSEFVRSLNVPTLRFPRNSLYQDTFSYAQAKIKTLVPLN